MTNFSEFGDEEEDVKPSIEQLNSLSEYRKRSRSVEDVGSPGPVKTPKINGMTTPNGFVSQEIAAAPETVVEEEVNPGLAEDPLVMGTSLRCGDCSTWTHLRLNSEWPAYTILAGYRGAPRADDSRRVHGVLRTDPGSVMTQRPVQLCHCMITDTLFNIMLMYH